MPVAVLGVVAAFDLGGHLLGGEDAAADGGEKILAVQVSEGKALG